MNIFIYTEYRFLCDYGSIVYFTNNIITSIIATSIPIILASIIKLDLHSLQSKSPDLW